MNTDELFAKLRIDAAKPDGDRTRYDAAWEIKESPENVPRIAKLLTDAEPHVRGMAAWLIGQFACAYGDDDEKASAAEPALEDLAKVATSDPSSAVRVSAVRALQFFAGHPPLRAQVLPLLERALVDESPDARVCAAFGLLRLKVALPDVARELGAALQRPEPPRSNLHQEACFSLTEMGRSAAPAVQGLLALLFDAPDPDLAVSIIEALGAAGTPEAIAALRDLDDSETQVGRAAQLALQSARS